MEFKTEGSRQIIIIRNLPWSLTEEELASTISQFGAFEKIELKIHSDSGKSKGWAMVTYQNLAVAQAAVEALQGLVLNERKIQATLEECKASIKVEAPRQVSDAGHTRNGHVVFISNLPWSMTAQEINKLVSPHGQTISVEIAKHSDTTKPKGWGLITFSEKIGAESAIRALNAVEVAGRRLALRMDRVQVPNTGSECNVYVGNLSFDVDNDQLLAYFQEFQPVSAEVARTSFGTARGFGIIEFSTPQAAAAAIERFNGKEMAGRNIECRQDKGTSQKPRDSLYVGNIGYRKTDDELREMFAHIGTITSAEIQRRKNGQSKQWAKLTFASPEHNAFAVETMNGTIDPSTGVRIVVSFNRK